MAQIIKGITVDVAKKNLFQAIMAKQYDEDSRFLQVTLVNEGVPIDVDASSSVSIYAERADGATNSFPGKVNGDGTVTVPIDSWMLQLDDMVRCDISVKEGESRKLTSASFYIEVERAANSGNNIPTGDFEIKRWVTLEERIAKLEKGGANGKDGYTPVKGVDYWTDEDIAAINAANIAYISTELAKRGQIKPEFAKSVKWLDENGDQTKLYVLSDKSDPNYGYIYEYRLTEVEVDGGAAYTNLLPLATDTDRTTIYNGKGYIEGYRLSSSGNLSALSNACASGFITASVGDVLRIKGITPIQGTATQYIITYDSSNAVVNYQQIPDKDDNSDWGTSGVKSWYQYNDGVITVTLDSTNFGTGFNAIRFSAGTISADTIVTINEEIKENDSTTVTEYAWASTGHALVPADYEDRIIAVEKATKENTSEIEKLKSGVVDIDAPITYIREWDAPIYDRTPVYELKSEKAALTTADKTVAAVYAKYDALMAENPDFITRTDLGLCSDGVTHVYRYDFCERDGRHQSGFEWSETKPKFIIATGVHREWNGIYSMYNALAEITTDSDLAELRRSVHFIIVPVVNPYSISGPYSEVAHCANANGVEIHRNFEVGFAVSNQYNDDGTNNIHYSGATPLSEVESQYIDNILKNNSDAAYFLTCHAFDRDHTWGVGFLWGSSATKYMCNMVFRVIDKMGKAWHKKYGKTWEDGIARQNAVVLADSNAYPNAKALEAGDYRIGHAALTDTGGCEQRQATKYGIQATNFEVGETFFVLDETMSSAKAITHGTEAYINFFRTAMDCYDRKDKKDYAPNLL